MNMHHTHFLCAVSFLLIQPLSSRLQLREVWANRIQLWPHSCRELLLPPAGRQHHCSPWPLNSVSSGVVLSELSNQLKEVTSRSRSSRWTLWRCLLLTGWCTLTEKHVHLTHIEFVWLHNWTVRKHLVLYRTFMVQVELTSVWTPPPSGSVDFVVVWAEVSSVPVRPRPSVSRVCWLTPSFR